MLESLGVLCVGRGSRGAAEDQALARAAAPNGEEDAAKSLTEGLEETLTVWKLTVCWGDSGYKTETGWAVGACPAI